MRLLAILIFSYSPRKVLIFKGKTKRAEITFQLFFHFQHILHYSTLCRANHRQNESFLNFFRARLLISSLALCSVSTPLVVLLYAHKYVLQKTRSRLFREPATALNSHFAKLVLIKCACTDSLLCSLSCDSGAKLWLRAKALANR